LDKYILPWFKDYFVYYSLPGCFGEFIRDNGLQKYYEENYDSSYANDIFNIYCAISGYDIKRSPFYCDETQSLIQDTVKHVISALESALGKAGQPLDKLLYNAAYPAKPWNPFTQALFVPWPEQPDKTVFLSFSEIYRCRKNQWTCRTVKQCNRKLAGYILKQTEALLREENKYKRPLTVNLRDLDDNTLIAFQVSGIKPDIFIRETVAAFLYERNRVTVTVDPDSLVKIRKEALETQEKLTVEEASKIEQSPIPERESTPFLSSAPPPPAPAGNSWENFANALTPGEHEALAVILRGGDITDHASNLGQMAEVIIDGINQKCMDTVGDTLMDFDIIYPEYMDKVSRLNTQNRSDYS
jgi:hypothetical protein